jgi:DNA polymerase III delta prime subunit
MTQRGLSLIFYGTEGVGKTSLALQFKKEVLCISANESLFANLEMVGDIPDGCESEDASTYPELLKCIRSGKDYNTVVIDSLSGVQQLMGDHILKHNYASVDDPQREFTRFSEGYRCHAPFLAEQICNELTLLNLRGVNTILIGHCKMETIKNPSGNDYNATVIDMESWPRAVFKKWASAILYMTLDLEVMVTKTWKGKPMEGKAKTDLESESDRIMYTTKNPAHEAKNLLKLPPYISLGESAEEAYDNFISKLPPKLQEAQK